MSAAVAVWASPGGPRVPVDQAAGRVRGVVPYRGIVVGAIEYAVPVIAPRSRSSRAEDRTGRHRADRRGARCTSIVPHRRRRCLEDKVLTSSKHSAPADGAAQFDRAADRKPLVREGISAIVLRTTNPNRTLWDAILPEECLGLPAGLAEVDRLLDDPRFFEPFRPFFHPSRGRPSIPMETFLRIMFLRRRYGLGYTVPADSGGRACSLSRRSNSFGCASPGGWHGSLHVLGAHQRNRGTGRGVQRLV